MIEERICLRDIVDAEIPGRLVERHRISLELESFPGRMKGYKTYQGQYRRVSHSHGEGL